MYLKRIISIVLLSYSFCFAGSEPGFLTIKSVSGKNIYLDSLYLGKQSFEFLALHPGDYTIRVSHDNDRIWNKRDYVRHINIKSKSHEILDVQFQEYIYINSRPFGSNVYSNGTFHGKTPLYLERNLLKNNNELLFRLDGFDDKRVKIFDAINNIDIRLENGHSGDDIHVLSAEFEYNDHYIFKQSMIITSIISSWASFYLKREADKNYDKYLVAGNPDKMNKYFDRTVNFDRYSEVAAVLSITTLSIYMYYLIFE